MDEVIRVNGFGSLYLEDGRMDGNSGFYLTGMCQCNDFWADVGKNTTSF